MTRYKQKNNSVLQIDNLIAS